MAIKIGDQINYAGPLHDNARQEFDTMAEMKSAPDYLFPATYTAYCKEAPYDKTSWVFNVNNTEDSITGKWRKSPTKEDVIQYYSDEVTYAKNDIVKEEDSAGNLHVFFSLNNNNIGNDPVADDGTNWYHFKQSYYGVSAKIGDIVANPLIDENAFRKYLNGQEITSTNYPAFCEKMEELVVSRPQLFCTLAEWTAIASASAHGQCGKFVFTKDASTNVITVKLPKVVKFQGLIDLNNLGTIVPAGLPNITATVGSVVIKGDSEPWKSGALKDTSFADDVWTVRDGTVLPLDMGYFDFKASNSNAIYGKSGTVQEEAIQYPYLIYVANELNLDRTQLMLQSPFELFDFKLSDKVINSVYWVLADGNWVNGDIYKDAYNKLVDVYTNGTTGSDVVGSTTISYKKLDGMKVTTDKASFDAIYAAQGTAWYYVLDTANHTFVLPMSNNTHFEASDATNVGKFITAGIPNIKGSTAAAPNSWNLNYSLRAISGAYSQKKTAPLSSFPNVDGGTGGAYTNDMYVDFSAKSGEEKMNGTLKNDVYGKSDTVQPNSVKCYLYFYLGYFQSIEQELKHKDIDLKRYILDTFYPIGTEYRTKDSSFNPNNSFGGTWTQQTDSKYVYNHNLTLITNSQRLFTNITTESSTSFNQSTLLSYLNTHNMTGGISGRTLILNGGNRNSNYSAFCLWNHNNALAIGRLASSGTEDYDLDTMQTFIDNVVPVKVFDDVYWKRTA